MPVTAKLSRKFYERLGDDVANELVDWFNQVDVTYRTDLRELNQLNFDRFRAEIEKAVAQLRAELGAEIARVEHRLLGRLEAGLANQRAGLLKWMFGFWVAQAATTAGLFLALAR